MVNLRRNQRRLFLVVAAGLLNAIPLAAAPYTGEAPLLFKTECAKTEIYYGEQTLCNFVIYSFEEVVEVEVAKFPEFRGFWSDNVALRQGPIPLVSILGSPPGVHTPGTWRRGVVGSYMVAPMLGKTDPVIEPMKLAVRRSFSYRRPSLPEGVLFSEAPKLALKPVPSLPTSAKLGADAGHFHGAIGAFTLQTETPEVAFQKDEPVALRFSLTGEGNFQEINDIDLPSVPNVEVLSRKEYTQGAGQFSTKTFEMTLVAHTAKSFVMPPVVFLYFNPQKRDYERLVTSPIPFAYVPPAAPSKAQEAEADDDLQRMTDRLEPQWTAYRPLWKRWTFLLSQGLMLFAVFSLAAVRIVDTLRRKHLASSAYQRSLRWNQALAELAAGHEDAFLWAAEALVFDLISNAVGMPVGASRAEVLRLAEKRLPPEQWTLASSLVANYETYAYSPAKAQRPDVTTVRANVERLLAERNRLPIWSRLFRVPA